MQPGVPLSLVLQYENGAEVRSQNILQMLADTQLVTNEQGRANLKVRHGGRARRRTRRREKERRQQGTPVLDLCLLLSRLGAALPRPTKDRGDRKQPMPLPRPYPACPPPLFFFPPMFSFNCQASPHL